MSLTIFCVKCWKKVIRLRISKHVQRINVVAKMQHGLKQRKDVPNKLDRVL